MKPGITNAASLAFLLLLPLFATACDSSQENAQSRAGPREVQVGVVSLKSTNVPYRNELPGRAVAFATAEIRPQVDGLVKKRVFREGREVKAGDILYQLDPGKFEAARAAADAAVQKAQASLDNAQSKYDRSAQLVKTNAISAQVLDNDHTALLQAQADLASARAALLGAQINLDDATLKAPIDGLISRSSVSDGALVTANQTAPLATIRQLDPIYIDLVDSSTNLLRLRAMFKSGNLGGAKGPPRITLKLEDGSTYDQTGKLNLADVVVSESTGTFSLRATIANPRRLLLPGMFVRATVDLGATPNAFLVPQRAVTRNSSGQPTVLVVGTDNKVETRVLTADRIYESAWVATAGLEDGDKVIVDGFQKISNGTPVTPVEVKIDEDGVVRQTLDAAAPSANGGAGK